MTTQFGKYVLSERLATGGMAEIFLAKKEGEAGFAKQCVIKRILPHLASDDQFIRMFLDEARLAAQLNHPNIVQIFDLGAQDNTYFVAMEYVRGWSLSRAAIVLANHGLTFPLHLAAWIVAKMCAGLDYAHNLNDANGEPLGIVHRDISPDNVLVTGAGEVKLIDFGIAKARGRDTKTEVGTVKGKFRYMSPEQVTGQAVDCRSDLFSLGIVLYEISTMRRPFLGDNDVMTATSIVKDEPTMPGVYLEGYPKDLERIILKSLAKRATDRYSSARELQADLEAYLQRVGRYPTERDVGEYMQRLMSQPQPDLDFLKAIPTGLTLTAEPAYYEEETAAMPGVSAVPAPASPRQPAVRTALVPSQPAAPARPSAAPKGRSMWLVPLIVVLAAGLGVGGYFLYAYLSPSTDAGLAKQRLTAMTAGALKVRATQGTPATIVAAAADTVNPKNPMAAGDTATNPKTPEASPVRPPDAVGAATTLATSDVRVVASPDSHASAPETTTAADTRHAPPDSATPTEAPGFVEVPEVKPPANILVDGRAVGMTPRRIDLPPGSYIVEFERGSQHALEQVDVRSGQALIVTPKFTAEPAKVGYLKINSYKRLPVSIANVSRVLYNKPMPVPPGSYTIRYQKSGTTTWILKTVHVPLGRTVEVVLQ